MKGTSLGISLVVCILLGTADAMPPERVVAEQVRAYNARDLDWFVSLYTRDAAIHQLLSGELIGQGEAYFRQRYADRFRSSPDLHATIHDRIVLGEYVIDFEEVVRKKSDPTVSALAIYHVDQSRIDHVWFAFDEDVQLAGAEATKAAMARYAAARQRRDAAACQEIFAPQARIVNLADGRTLRGSRHEIMAELQSLFAGEPPAEWRLEQQIVFGNVVVNLESQRSGDAAPASHRAIVYHFTSGRIAQGWVITEVPHAERTAPLVATHYFYWYRWPDQHFNQPGAPGAEGHFHHLPNPEKVSYTSQEWHSQQFAAMHRAGIDIALPVYWGAPGAYERGSIRFSRDGLPPMVAALRSLGEQGVRLGLFYDTSTLLNGVRGLSPPEVRANLTTPAGLDLFTQTIIEYFEQIPVELWARVEGRPLVVLYAAAFAEQWNPDLSGVVRERFQRRFPGEQPFIVADASWGDMGQDRTTSWGAALAGPKLFPGVAQIGPGYNDTPVPGRTTPIREREEGNFYRASWRAAVAHRPQLVLIETWNEMHEGTEICETIETGTTYLDITAEWIGKLKQAADPGPDMELRWKDPIPRPP